MKKIIIALLLCLAIVPVAVAMAAPQPQYHRANNSGVTVEGYFYNYNKKAIDTITLRVNHRKVVAYWNNDVWQTCSIRLQKNDTGDTSTDTPDEWRELSQKFMYKVVIKGITLYLDTENA